MRRITFVLLITILPLASLITSVNYTLASYGFIDNQGQMNEVVRYLAAGPRVSIFFTSDSVVLDFKVVVNNPQKSPTRFDPGHPMMPLILPAQLSQQVCAVKIHFENASPAVTQVAPSELVVRDNYFLGNNPHDCRNNVSAFAEIVYRDFWPGIDLVCHIQRGVITYEAVVALGVDSSQVGFHYEGAVATTEVEEYTYQIQTSVVRFLDLRPTVGRRCSGKLCCS